MHQQQCPSPPRALDNVLPLYFDIDSIDPALAAEIIDILSQLSLRTTGYTLESAPTPAR